MRSFRVKTQTTLSSLECTLANMADQGLCYYAYYDYHSAREKAIAAEFADTARLVSIRYRRYN